MSLQADLELAHRIADAAAEVTLRHFGHVRYGWKLDGSPVTEADLEADERITSMLAAERPDDGILSEESGTSRGTSGRRWILDPLDGTSAYLRAGTGWGTLLALEDGGELVLGVIDHPADGRRWWATRGGGAWRARTGGGRRSEPAQLQLSDVTSLDEARVTVWQPYDTPRTRAIRTVGRWVPPDMHFMERLLDGEIDVLVSTGGEIWDHAAAVVVFEEAGGRFRDPRGGRRLDLYGGTYTTAALEHAVLELLGIGPRAPGWNEAR